jgi:chaperonin GroEL
VQIGADIVKRALPYSLKLIASNAGDNGSVVMQRVIESSDPNFGYNAATGKFEDLMAAGIIDPAKVGGALEAGCRKPGEGPQRAV